MLGIDETVSATLPVNGAMAEYPRFPNAPIAEAFLDVTVRLPPGTTHAKLASLHERFADRYPIRAERLVQRAQFLLDAAGAHQGPASQEAGGFLHTSRDGTRIIQARTDGFSFHQLKPYTHWEAVRDEAREAWAVYVDVAQPAAVERIDLRYVNRIEIPLPCRDLTDYILTVPRMAPGLPERLDAYFMQLVQTWPAYEAVTIVSSTIEAAASGPTGQRLPVIFDIDVFSQGPFDPRTERMWERFERLRVVKNEIFFRSVTKRAEELFQ